MVPHYRGVKALLFLLALALCFSACSTEKKDEVERKKPEKVVQNPNTNPDTKIEPERPPSLADERPNVMLILVDDMTMTDLPYLPKTVRLLGDQGVTFENMIAPNPLCCPARASLITGQYTHNNGVYSNQGLHGGIDALREPDNTVAGWLQKAGYSTAFFGKYLNGYSNAKTEPIPLGWDWWDATGKGTYAFTRFQFANNGKPRNFEDDYVTTRLRKRSDWLLHSFANERKETGKPFFIFDSYVAPHGAIGAPEEDVAAVGPGPIPEEKYRNLYPKAVNPAENKPSFNVEIEDYPVRGVLRGTQYREALDLQTHFINRVRSLASVDDAVAKTVQTLRTTGQLDNTIIMFTSDNGYLLGEHQKFGKVHALTESIRVPLLVRGPGFPSGQTSRRWATHQDMVATIMEAAQAEAGRPLDGLTLNGASSADPEPNQAILVENGSASAETESDEAWNYRGLLMGTRYTYTQWSTSGKGEELYDNLLDPYQLRNVAKSGAYGEVLAQARSVTEKLKDCSGPGACMYPLADLAKPNFPNASSR